MDLMSKAQTYLSSISETVAALSGMVCCDELEDKAEVQRKIIITMIELEQSTADFISDLKLDSIASQSVAVSKGNFISSNECVIRHLEKIQLQGYNFSKLTTSLKLENETLTKEIDFL